MTGAPECLVAEVEKLLRNVEDGVAKTRAAAPTEAERPTESHDERETRSCFDAVRRPRVTADIVAGERDEALHRDPERSGVQLTIEQEKGELKKEFNCGKGRKR